MECRSDDGLYSTTIVIKLWVGERERGNDAPLQHNPGWV